PLPAVVLLALLALGACDSAEQRVIRSVADAEDARIGVVTGTTPADIAHARFPDADIQSFGDTADVLGALQAGHIDVQITAINTAILAARNNPDLAVIEESLSNEITAIAIRKGNDALREQVNGVIAALKADGTLADMSRRWLKREPGPYEQIEIALPTTGAPLRIGVNATREPFSFVDEAGRISGHDGDLARLIGARLDRPIEFVDVRFDALIPGLQSGKMDLIVTGMSATDERRKFVDFSDPYYDNKIVMLTRRAGPDAGSAGDSGTVAASAATGNSGFGFRTLDDVARRPLGVLQGSAHDTWAQKHLPNTPLLQFLSVADLLVAVEAGKADAGIIDADTMVEVAKTRLDLVTVGDSLFSSNVGAGFRKDSQALRAEFDAFLAEIGRNGVLADLKRRWYEVADFRMPAIETPADGEPLVVGNAIVGLPSVAVQDNELVGYEVELALRFAAHTGRRVEWSTVDWGALIPSLVGGRTDAIISGMYITPERQERIDFSRPYHRSDNYIFAHKRNVAPPAGATSGTTDGTTAGTTEEAEATAAAAPPEPSFWQGVAESFHSNIIREDRYLLLWDGLKTTVLLSILSSLFGTALGALVCYMRMSENTLLRQSASLYITILRGTPVLVLLMLIFYVAFASVAIDPVLVAVFAFGLNFAAYVSEIFRTGIQSIDRGQTEAGIAMGFSRVGTFRHIILPQTLQRILPVYKGEFISMVKMTSIVGYVAVQDLTKASDIIRSRTFDAFFPLIMVAILYFLISWILIQALEYLEHRTDPLRRRRREVRP
ncbi:MAG: ABC transporter permease subunit, partial [Gammaproteobacteria bacterium]